MDFELPQKYQRAESDLELQTVQWSHRLGPLKLQTAKSVELHTTDSVEPQTAFRARVQSHQSHGYRVSTAKDCWTNRVTDCELEEAQTAKSVELQTKQSAEPQTLDKQSHRHETRLQYWTSTKQWHWNLDSSTVKRRGRPKEFKTVGCFHKCKKPIDQMICNWCTEKNHLHIVSGNPCGLGWLFTKGINMHFMSIESYPLRVFICFSHMKYCI